METRRRLRQLLASPGLIEAVGVADAGHARLVEQAGFPAVYMSGSYVSFTYGVPDAGLLTMSEMVERARSIARRVRIPLIADADEGYGAALQVMRTIREYEDAGVAALHLEDMPAKHRGDPAPLATFVKRLQAAVEARCDPDLLIIARSDAMDPNRPGLRDPVARQEDCLRRCVAYSEAGADVIFVQFPPSAEVMRRFCREIPKPVMVTMGGHKFNEPAGVLEEIGIKVVLYPINLQVKALPVVKRTLEELRATRQGVYTEGERRELNDLNTLLGRDELRDLQTKYGE